VAGSVVKIIIQSLYKGSGAKQAADDLKGIEKFASALDGGFAAAGIAVAAVTSAVVALNKAIEFGEQGAQVKRLEDSFTSLSAAAGTSGEQLLSALNKAARGTVSNTDLILSANRAMMLGLGADSEQLANLLEVAAFRGRAMGLSTTQAFNDIVTGVGRASPMILDNLGIVIDAEQTYQDYADSIGKSKSELTKAEKTQALLTRTIEEGNKQIEDAGGYVDDTAAAYERLHAATKNATDANKKYVSEALVPTVNWLTQVIDYQKRVIEGLDQEKGIWQARADAAKKSADVTNDVAAAIDGWGNAIDDTTPKVEDNTGAVEDNTEALKAQSDAYSTILSNMFKVNSEQDRYAEKSDELLKKRQELQDELTREKITYQQQYNAGQITLAQTQEHIRKVDDLTTSIQENEQAIAKNAEEHKNATSQMIFDLVQQRLAQDGISSSEFEYLQNLALKYGLVTAADRDKAIQISQSADQAIQDFENQQKGVETLQSRLEDLGARGPYRPQVIVEFIADVSGMSEQPAPIVPVNPVHPGQGGYAEGGSFVVPGTGNYDQPYINYFTPGELVTVTPKGEKAGATVNISVGDIRSLSDLDYLAQEVQRRITA